VRSECESKCGDVFNNISISQSTQRAKQARVVAVAVQNISQLLFDFKPRWVHNHRKL